jgi:hypothetical protein
MGLADCPLLYDSLIKNHLLLLRSSLNEQRSTSSLRSLASNNWLMDLKPPRIIQKLLGPKATSPVGAIDGTTPRDVLKPVKTTRGTRRSLFKVIVLDRLALFSMKHYQKL